jgi:hypothetical protein
VQESVGITRQCKDAKKETKHFVHQFIRPIPCALRAVDSNGNETKSPKKKSTGYPSRYRESDRALHRFVSSRHPVSQEGSCKISREVIWRKNRSLQLDRGLRSLPCRDSQKPVATHPVTLPQGRSLRRNDRPGRVTQYSSVAARWSGMDGAERYGPPRSFLATLPRGG